MTAWLGRSPGRALWLAIALLPRIASGGEPTVEDLQARLPALAGEARITALNQLADPDRSVSPAKALEYASEAQRLAHEAGDAAAESLALRNVGNARLRLSSYPEALTAFQLSLALSEKLADRKGMRAALNGIGSAHYYQSRLTLARENYSKSLEIAQAIGDQRGVADALTNLGNVDCHLGNDRSGADNYARASQMYRALGREKSTALALNNLGNARSGLGDYPGALDAYLQAMAIEERLSNRPGIARASTNLGIVYRKLKQYDKAERSLQRALTIERELGDRNGMAGSLNNLGNLLAVRGDTRSALPFLEEALRIRQAIGDPRGTGNSLGSIGNVYARLKEHRKALQYYSRALPYFEKAGLKEGTTITLKSMGEQEAALGHYDAAARHLAKALGLAQQSEAKELVRDTYEALSNLHAAQGNFKQALDDHQRFSDLRQEILDHDSAAKLAEMQAKYESEKKQREIGLLQRDNDIQRLQLASARMRMYALVAGVLALVALLSLLVRRYLHLLAFWRSKSYVGHYRLLSQVGSGGMGIVYKATHVRDRTRPVAVKVLREEYAHDPVFQQRLKHEAALIDQLNHPHIVKVHERGEYDQRVFIAMEWLEGRTLARLIRENERLALGECVAIARQLADALAKIHSRGIVHRDVKPENVMLIEQDGDRHFVKLLDFDVAKSGSLTRLTQTGVAVGTLAYMAPEQIKEQQASPASDLYALGVVAYEALTREQPFFGASPIDVVRQILDQDPIPPAELRTDVPPELDALILDLLSKRPEQRPTDEVLADRLGAIEAQVTRRS
jgi:tetratricopeptide (TPR) repeat protein/tRNA A-37 threonylcarbamoyl transferase component Bud32